MIVYLRARSGPGPIVVYAELDRKYSWASTILCVCVSHLAPGLLSSVSTGVESVYSKCQLMRQKWMRKLFFMCNLATHTLFLKTQPALSINMSAFAPNLYNPACISDTISAFDP